MLKIQRKMAENGNFHQEMNENGRKLDEIREIEIKFNKCS